MSEPLLISPLLDGFVMGDPISSHDGVRACPAMYLETEQKHIVKIISLPATQSKLDALLLAGAFADREGALSYFKELADGVVEEAALLQKLSRNEGFVAFDSWQMVPMDNDETGYDVYLLGQYRPTLEGVLKGNEMTHLQGINLGLDLCAALCAARRFGYMYTNLRPSNVFICNEREFRIGDLGFMSLNALHYTSLPDKYRSAYTAPEISDAYSALNLTMDTYAVGLILYQAYNDGQLPAAEQPLAAPRHADPALAEIILKACAVNPDDRWQDPVQMGQALATYMQSNPVNDTPIAPPPIETVEEEPEEIFPDEDTEPSTADILAEVDDALDAIEAMMPLPENAGTEEETVPEETEDTEAETSEEEAASEENAEEVDPTEEESIEEAAGEEAPADTPEAEEEQDDVSQMLAQADDLIAHQLPDPPVAPEPIDVNLPTPEEEIAEEEPAEESAEVVLPQENPPEEQPQEEEDEDSPAYRHRKVQRTIKVACILVALALFLVTGVSIFYQNYYLQTVEDIIVVGDEDNLSVQLITDIPDEKLTVICTDTHGNALTSPVKNGIATFEALKPDTTYTLEVSISGMHKLMGEIKETYSTGSSTVISGFYATTGLEDGSVILYFTVQGTDSAQWTVTYRADGEDEISTAPFSGRQCTLTGLTVGKEYTFTLAPARDLYISGTDTITYTISKVIYPEDVRALGFSEQGLGIVWNTPDGATVNKWYVRCYNDSGYDKTLSTEENVIYFADLDASADYTVEVKADGMSLGTRLYISANALTIKDLTVDESDPLKLTVSWDANGYQPVGGWLLLYTIDSSTSQQVITCEDSKGVIPLRIPGAHYSIRIKPADGVSVFGGELDYNAPAAGRFSGFLVTADNMTFSMCKTPSKKNWDHEDVAAEDYKTSFILGESAAFVAHLDTKTSKVDDKVTTLYVIHDHEGRLISAKSEARTWDDMWDNRYGEFVIPTMPNDAGSYTIDIYFDGAAVMTQTFTIGVQ